MLKRQIDIDIMMAATYPGSKFVVQSEWTDYRGELVFCRHYFCNGTNKSIEFRISPFYKAL